MARSKHKTLRFQNDGKQDLETIATEFDALHTEISMVYDDDYDAINGTRATMLLDALPPWLAQKIQEQGCPHDCPQEQWSYGRVLG